MKISKSNFINLIFILYFMTCEISFASINRLIIFKTSQDHNNSDSLQELNAKEFLKQIQDKINNNISEKISYPIIISNLIITEAINLKYLNLTDTVLIFRNVLFKRSLNINNCNLYSVDFDNCIFQDGINFCYSRFREQLAFRGSYIIQRDNNHFAINGAYSVMNNLIFASNPITIDTIFNQIIDKTSNDIADLISQDSFTYTKKVNKVWGFVDLSNININNDINISDSIFNSTRPKTKTKLIFNHTEICNNIVLSNIYINGTMELNSISVGKNLDIFENQSLVKSDRKENLKNAFNPYFKITHSNIKKRLKFEYYGKVDLSYSSLGLLDFSNAELYNYPTNNPESEFALNAFGLTIKSSAVFFNSNVTNGVIRLTQATIEKDLDFSGAIFNKQNNMLCRIEIRRAHIKGNTYFKKPDYIIPKSNPKLMANLDFTESQFDGSIVFKDISIKSNSIDLTATTINRELIFENNEFSPNNTDKKVLINLTQAFVHFLNDKCIIDNLLNNKLSMPISVNADGLTYDSIYLYNDNPYSRNKWFNILTNLNSPQPYEEYSQFLKNQGYRDDALAYYGISLIKRNQDNLIIHLFNEFRGARLKNPLLFPILLALVAYMIIWVIIFIRLIVLFNLNWSPSKWLKEIAKFSYYIILCMITFSDKLTPYTFKLNAKIRNKRYRQFDSSKHLIITQSFVLIISTVGKLILLLLSSSVFNEIFCWW